ncbi:MAG: class I SAM-dependent methyltransferase [Verrucomicrobiaceae bacterium]|nr:class I SAM-dependent methyltransferase [Verrucomicrobiaceae bacterium]
MSTQNEMTDCLELMQRLIEYRYQKALHHQIGKAGGHSMLAVDVLVLIYHFAKISEGSILEIGSFVGGSTVAAGLGARDSGKRKKIISIEPGGRLKDHWLATKDIFKDLKKNLSRAGLLDAVTLINGLSFDETTIATVREMVGPNEIGLFIFDADANVRRDIDCYGDRFSPGCWVVIDDYISESEKGGPTRNQVDELVAAGRLQPLGLYGWGTWVGRWLGSP